MQYTAIIFKAGQLWRGTVPDIPEIVVEHELAYRVEQELPAAVERYLDSHPGPAPPRDARWANVTAYTTKYKHQRRPPRQYNLEDMARMVSKIDALLDESPPSDVLNAIFSLRVELTTAIRMATAPEPDHQQAEDQMDGCGIEMSIGDLMDGVTPEGRAELLRLLFKDSSGTRTLNLAIPESVHGTDPEEPEPPRPGRRNLRVVK